MYTKSNIKFKPSKKKVIINSEKYILTNIRYEENWSYLIDELRFIFVKCSDNSILELSEYEINRDYNKKFILSNFDINIYLK